MSTTVRFLNYFSKRNDVLKMLVLILTLIISKQKMKNQLKCDFIDHYEVNDRIKNLNLKYLSNYGKSKFEISIVKSLLNYLPNCIKFAINYFFTAFKKLGLLFSWTCCTFTKLFYIISN